MSNWISVKDILPDCYEEVLIWPVFDSYGDRRTAWVTLAGDWCYHLCTENLGGDYVIDSEITHWQPLPEPPVIGVK